MTTQTTAEEIYDQVVKPLLPSERLRLATLILTHIPPQSVVDYSEEWSEEDKREFSTHSWRYAIESLGEEEQESPGRG